jgi:putative transposase
MLRRPRMHISGTAYPIVQRGVNREPCFFDVEDYPIYMELMRQLLPRYGIYLHACVLMTNHVHLLMTPDEKEPISNLLKVVGSRYARYINKKYNRTGALWEGRHKSSDVDSKNYLLKCYRYIELNPVAAVMVSKPEECRWSSFGCNAWGDLSSVIEPHSEYLTLGKVPEDRCYRYRDLFSVSLSGEDVHFIGKAAHYCRPLGGDRFRLHIEEKIGRPVGLMGRGRPRKLVT